MKYKGGINLYSAFTSSDFFIKIRNGSLLQKFRISFKYVFVLLCLLGISTNSFSNNYLPKARLTKSINSYPVFPGPTGHVNITISASTLGGTWSGTGTLLNPYTFTPSGTATATISATELATAINTYAYVKITTATTGNGASSGTVTFSSPVNSTSALSGTDRRFSVTAYSSIIISSSISLTTSNISGNENFKSSDIEFISETGNITIGSSVTTTPSVAFSESLSSYVAGGNISLTCSSPTGVISVTSSGSLIAVGGNNNNSTVTAPGRGGDVSLVGPGGITINGLINTSSGLNRNQLKQNGVAGTLTVNTNAASTVGGANDGQSTSTQFSIGAFTKEGTGNFVVKNFKNFIFF